MVLGWGQKHGTRDLSEEGKDLPKDNTKDSRRTEELNGQEKRILCVK